MKQGSTLTIKIPPLKEIDSPTPNRRFLWSKEELAAVRQYRHQGYSYRQIYDGWPFPTKRTFTAIQNILSHHMD